MENYCKKDTYHCLLYFGVDDGVSATGHTAITNKKKTN